MRRPVFQDKFLNKNKHFNEEKNTLLFIVSQFETNGINIYEILLLETIDVKMII